VPDLVSLRPVDLPLALARLQVSLAVDAVVSVRVGGGVDVGPLFEAGGFSVEGVRRGVVKARRLRTLPDIVGPGMRMLVCGLNPSLYSADAGVNFARPGNRFWPAALAAGVASVDRDPWGALSSHGVGFTDLVKRATVGAAALGADEYRAGAERLAWTVGLLEPGVVCFVGLTGYRAVFDRKAMAGPVVFAGRPGYLMPNTSGLNAGTQLGGFVSHLQAAVALAGGGGGAGTRRRP
jgi:TDG/mug DNA glycosylase family protein